jgi:DNA-binding IclR family transcriptional regulator
MRSQPAKEIPMMLVGNRTQTRDGDAREQNKATVRILSVLSAFAKDNSANGVTELSEQLGMSKNMVYRALTTLSELGYLVRNDDNKKYELGYRVAELQNSNFQEPDLRALSAPYIEAIHRLTRETVCLSVRSGDYIVFIDGIETKAASVWRLNIGGIRPLHAPTSSARVTLAFLHDDEIESYLARRFKKLSGSGVTDEDRIWKDVRDIRKRGYAVTTRKRMVAVAFPIFGDDDRLHGVIATGGPEERSGERVIDAVPRIKELVDELNAHTRLYSLDVTPFWQEGEE